MRVRRIAVLVAGAAVWVAPLGVCVPWASAAPCPDVEVVFARGTTELPGVGPTGDAFLDALRPRLAGKSMSVYAVDYPATLNFKTSLDGIADASTHIRSMTASCPDTRLVLGGFSQGAAVMGFVTANVIPDGAPEGVPNPMPAEIAEHVAAVALFGKPNARFMNAIKEPQIVIGPLYAGKTIEMCVPEDPICSAGTDFNAHNAYADTGLVYQAAAFAASRVASAATAPGASGGPVAPTAPVSQAAITGTS